MAKQALVRKTEKVMPKAPIIKPNDLEKQIVELVNLVKTALPDERKKLKFLADFGVGTSIDNLTGNYFTCHKCGRVLPRKSFYVSTEIGCESGITPICKECADEIARPTIKGDKTPPDKTTVTKTLEYLRKPFLDSVWDCSIAEASNINTGKTKTDVWTSYIKNIQLPNYYGKTYSDSNFYITDVTDCEEVITEAPRDKAILDEFEKNKADCLRLLGYMPFEQEKPDDQPFLYAQLIGFLDSSEEGNDDMMRTSSIISIVRCFLQETRTSDMIASLSTTTQNYKSNIASIKSLHESQQKLSAHITKLAEQSCISLKHSKNAKKGENTWTGKIKKIKDMNLREGEINGFDLNTCKGMQQVMEMSDASIMKQLRLDESEWSDMVAEQRELLRNTQRELDFYSEIARIILRENLDLRDFLKAEDLIDTDNLIDLDELYTPLMSDFKAGDVPDV